MGRDQAARKRQFKNHNGFNPRAHVGRDARAGGRRQGRGCFNPRAHVGRDSRTWLMLLHKFMFQSTRPRGARPSINSACCNWGGFNPRAHVGRDNCMSAELMPSCVFQSTRPRGARPRPRGNSSRCGCSFNPRAHVGRDIASVIDLYTSEFQSTRPRGARPSNSVTSRPVSLLFQSTRPRGARHILNIDLCTF